MEHLSLTLEPENPTEAALVQAIRSARRGDAKAAGQVADFCRFQMRMTYQQTFELVRRFWPEVELAEWDQLLAESEEGA